MTADTSMPSLDGFKFERFDKRNTRLVKKPELTVQSKGTFSLNAAAAQLIGTPEAVELLYDASQRVIGLRPISPEDPDAYPLRQVGKGATYVLSGSAFLKWFDIPYGEPVRREVTAVDGVLIVDLKDPGRDATSNRSRASKRSNSQMSSSPPVDDTDLEGGGPLLPGS